MIRLPAIGAAVFALGMLALPTFALPAKDESKLTHLDTRGQLQDVNLAEVVVTAEAQSDTAGLPTTWCGNETTVDNTANAALGITGVIVTVGAVESATHDSVSPTTTGLPGNAWMTFVPGSSVNV